MWAGCPLCGKLHPIAPLHPRSEHGDPDVLEPLGKIACASRGVVLYVYRRRGGATFAATRYQTKQED